MYINPITKQPSSAQAGERRKKAGGQTSFVEHVETLLELDAVDIARPHREQDQRQKGFGQSADKEEGGEEPRETAEEGPALKPGEKSLNITA